MAERWIILGVLFFARTVMAFQFQAVAALSPQILDSTLLTLADIGLLIGLYLGPGIVVAIPGGAIAARFGDKRVVGGSLALMCLGGLMMIAGDSLAVLAAGRVVAGIDGVILAGLVGGTVLLPLALVAPLGPMPALFLLSGMIFGLSAGPIMTLPGAILPVPARAFGMGVFFAVYYGLMLTGPLVAGGIADRAGDPGVAFLLGAGMMAACIGLLWGYRRTAIPV